MSESIFDPKTLKIVSTNELISMTLKPLGEFQGTSNLTKLVETAVFVEEHRSQYSTVNEVVRNWGVPRREFYLRQPEATVFMSGHDTVYLDGNTCRCWLDVGES